MLKNKTKFGKKGQAQNVFHVDYIVTIDIGDYNYKQLDEDASVNKTRNQFIMLLLNLQ